MSVVRKTVAEIAKDCAGKDARVGVAKGVFAVALQLERLNENLERVIVGGGTERDHIRVRT